MNKEVSYQLSNEISIKEAFLQEEIPGLEKEVSKQYLTIRVEEETLSRDIRFDSIQVEANYYSLPIGEGNNGLNGMIRIKLIEGSNLTLIEEAIVFYSENKQLFKQVISLETKSPIYLP